MASFSVSVRNRDDVGVRGKMKKDKSPNATVKIPSYEYNFISPLPVVAIEKNHKEE